MSISVSLEQTTRQYQRGEIIFRQGDEGTSMFMILSGSVEIVKDGVVIAQRGPSEFLGEMALVEDNPRSATAVAETDCEIAECSREWFIEIVRNDPTFALSVMKDLSHKLRESDSLRIKELEEGYFNSQIKNKELALMNDFLEQLIEQSPAGIVITNKQGGVKRANPAAASIFRLDLAEQGVSLLTYFPDDNPIANLWNSLRTSWVGELKALVQGQVRTLYISVSRLHSYDPEASYLLICEDISELIELNEQIVKLERFATEGEISAGIAHDIKNYLTILKGNFDLMQLKLDQQFKERHHNHIAAMERGFQEIESFVENLMGGRDDQGLVVDVNLAEMIRIMVRFLAPQKRFYRIKIETEVQPKFPRALKLREKQIQQVLLNLLINAADALNDMNEHPSREIRIELCFEPNSGRPQLRIADNGPGIPSERQSELFRRRYTTKEKGHGIGLLTVKKIIDQHQAEIAVESAPGKGTHFIITFAGQQ